MTLLVVLFPFLHHVTTHYATSWFLMTVSICLMLVNQSAWKLCYVLFIEAIAYFPETCLKRIFKNIGKWGKKIYYQKVCIICASILQCQFGAKFMP